MCKDPRRPPPLGTTHNTTAQAGRRPREQTDPPGRHNRTVCPTPETRPRHRKPRRGGAGAPNTLGLLPAAAHRRAAASYGAARERARPPPGASPWVPRAATHAVPREVGQANLARMPLTRVPKPRAGGSNHRATAPRKRPRRGSGTHRYGTTDSQRPTRLSHTSSTHEAPTPRADCAPPPKQQIAALSLRLPI